MSNKPKIYDVTATGSTEARDIRDRFADVINVKDYGAVGDGIVDDTASFKAASDAANGRYIYVPYGDYKITSSVSGLFYSDSDPILPQDYITLRHGAFAGNVRPVYISSTGDDKNDGRTKNTPIKTMGRAFAIMNAGTNVQYSFYLMGDAVYEVPSDIFVIGQSCPHFYSVDGSPTLKFTYTGGTGPRFYGGHVNISGSAGKSVKVDSAFGSLYFEGVAVGVTYVDFLVPVKIVGGSFTSTNLGVTSTDTSPAIIFSYTNAKISGTTFYNSPNNCRCIVVNHGTIFMGYGALTVANTFSDTNTDSLITIEHSFSKLSLNGFGDKLPTNCNALTAFSAVVLMARDLYEAYQALGISNTNSTFLCGKQKISGLNKGDVYNLNDYYANGCLTGGNKRLAFSIPLPHSLDDEVTAVKVSFSSLSVRGATGAIVSGHAFSNMSSCSVNINGDRTSLTLYMDFKASLGGTNNSVVSIQFAGLKLTME